jgi:guanylate kinase
MELVSDVKHAPEAFDPVRPYLNPLPVWVVFSGPAGVGKDSLLDRMRAMGYPFHFVVTTTDRAPRVGEVNGVHYHFVSTARFHELVRADAFIERARVYDQNKGVTRVEVSGALNAGKDVVMRLDVQGAETIKSRFPQAVTVFIAPPSLDDLVDRLRGRQADSAAQIDARLVVALDEIQRIDRFDYVVINHRDRLDEAARDAVAIISAEKRRVGRRAVSI